MQGQDDVERLHEEQQRDDTAQQRPEEYGGDHGTPVLSIQALGLDDMADDSLDGVAVSGVGLGGDYDEAKGPGLRGRFRQREQRTLWGHVEDPESPAAKVVRDAVAGMTDEQRETFRLVFGERLSERAAAERLGISQPAVHYRVETLKRIVTRALVQASGGEAVGA